MDGEGAVDAFQHSLVDHVLGAVEALFAGLEHEAHLAGEAVLVAGQQSGGAGEHCHMRVVAAGVHLAVVLRLEVEREVLLQRQGIHVAAQQDRGAGPARVEIGDHRCGRLAEGDVEAEAGECVGDPLLRARQVEAELGILVDGAAQLDRVIVDGGRRSGDVGSEVSVHPPRLADVPACRKTP